ASERARSGGPRSPARPPAQGGCAGVRCPDRVETARARPAPGGSPPSTYGPLRRDRPARGRAPPVPALCPRAPTRARDRTGGGDEGPLPGHPAATATTIVRAERSRGTTWAPWGATGCWCRDGARWTLAGDGKFVRAACRRVVRQGARRRRARRGGDREEPPRLPTCGSRGTSRHGGSDLA